MSLFGLLIPEKLSFTEDRLLSEECHKGHHLQAWVHALRSIKTGDFRSDSQHIDAGAINIHITSRFTVFVVF